MDEGALIRGLRRRNPAALEALIRQYTPFASAVANGILGNSPRDAEEVVADAFLALWDNGDKLRPGKLRPYLGAVVRNRAKNRLRQLGGELPLEEDALELLPAEGSPAAWLEEREQARLVREALDALPPHDREIFLRHYYYGHTVAQIGGAMGMNPATVKTRLRRGRKKLRDSLEQRGFFCEDTDF